METNSNYTPKQTVIYMALTAILGGVSPMASAATLNATADYNVGSGSENDSEGPSAVSVDILDSDFGPTGNVFYHTYGNADGNFGARVSGSGTEFDITSTFSFNENYSNTTGAAQDYSFDFTIIPGEISTSELLVGASPGNNLFASYDIDVILTTTAGATTIFDSAASISTDGAGSVFSETGTSLGGTPPPPGSSFYSWGTYTDSLSLGSIAGGESFSIDYILTTAAIGSLASITNCSFGGEGGFEGGEGGCSAIARSGDPFGLNGGNTFSIASSASVVPVPAAVWLFGSGLIGLVGFARRKKA